MARKIEVPGAATPGEPEAPETATLDPADELAALRAENARLRAAAAPATPSVVYTPETPHGKQAKAASKFAHLTCAELMAKIDAGDADEPTTNVLCSDGYYATRRPRKE